MTKIAHKTRVEAALALTSIAVGVTGAILTQPIILAAASVIAVMATAIRLTDPARHSEGNKAKIVG
jgi:hypothetical protein